jgi:hypothetical protein
VFAGAKLPAPASGSGAQLSINIPLSSVTNRYAVSNSICESMHELVAVINAIAGGNEKIA